jgi:hypothetical protein
MEDQKFTDMIKAMDDAARGDKFFIRVFLCNGQTFFGHFYEPIVGMPMLRIDRNNVPVNGGGKGDPQVYIELSHVCAVEGPFLKWVEGAK